MQKTILVVQLCALLLATLCYAQPLLKVTADGERIDAEIQFAECQITPFNKAYQQITIAGLPTGASPGKPALPFYHFRALLPPGRNVKEIVVRGQHQVLKGHYRLRPAAVSIPWFVEQKSGKLAKEAPVYRQSEFFPGNLHSPQRLSILAGYRLVEFNIYPVQYQPLAGKIHYYPQLAVSIHLGVERTTGKVRQDYAKKIQAQVVNPQVASQYNSRDYLSVASRDIPYLIITTKTLLASDGEYNFATLIAFLQERGVATEIATVEDIYLNYPGRDKPEQIRNFIKFAFENWNTRYVLLGGDADKGNELVPVRRFKINLHYVYMDGSSLTVNEMMASDYYYSALDGDFDGNSNGYYGEPEDNIDLAAEVAVGRAPIDDKQQLNNFVRKTILAYRHADEVTKPTVLMLGEHLFSPGQCGVNHHVYGAAFMNELLEGADTHGFHTCGFSEKWAVEKLYEKEQSWGSSQVIAKLSSSGACWVNHIGHSSPSYNMHLYRSSIDSLTNTVPFFYYTQGCNAGRFTNENTAPIGRQADKSGERGYDCYSEYLVFSDHGAFAVISNWSYGLSPEDPETSSGDAPGASQYFHRYLVDAFFNSSVKLVRIGDMLAYSREQMNPWLLDPMMQTQTVRWVYYQANLLGDPHAPLPVR